MKNTGGFQFPALQWWWGVVEDRMDPKQLGRVRVRVYGYHTGEQGKMATNTLPWAMVLQPIQSAANSSIGFSPTGIVEGTTVWGVFLDGDQAQTPLVIGTFAGINSGEGFEGGFKDPNGKYPRKKGSSDVNPLALGDSKDTVIQRRKEGNESGQIAFGGQWQEKNTAYAAKYPYNQVYESESGHVREYDDTSGAERISETHRSGTFYEVHPDGSKVTKVVKDNYEIIHGDDFVKVKGTVNVIVEGNVNLKVNGDANIEVGGNVKEQIDGNYELKIGGNYEVDVGGHHYQNASSHFKAIAARVDLNP